MVAEGTGAGKCPRSHAISKEFPKFTIACFGNCSSKLNKTNKKQMKNTEIAKADGQKEEATQTKIVQNMHFYK